MGLWDPWFFFFFLRRGGAGNGLRCFRKLSRIDWLGPDGGGHALWPRKWSQGTLPPHFLLRLSATAALRLAFSFSQQTLRPFLVSVPPLSSTLFALTPASLWSYGSADMTILWVKRWWEQDSWADPTFYTSYITGMMPQFLLLYFGKMAK